MRDKTIAILESRVGEQMAELVRKRGGQPLCAPALAELPDLDRAHLQELVTAWQAHAPDVFVFQTGVGTRALFVAADELGLTDRLVRWLGAARVVARGPKPTAALRARGVRIDDAAAEPFTTHEVLCALDAGPSIRGLHAVVQRYGETNAELNAELERRGATVTEIATYRWALPADVAPLLGLIDELERDSVDAVAFTSSAQATNLFAVAEQNQRQAALREGLARTLVASIGPVCSSTLHRLGVRVDLEARPPKLGPFLSAIDEALSAPGRAR